MNGFQLSLFTTVTAFGTPQDITLAELAVELFYPSDDVTEAALRSAQSATNRSANRQDGSS
jgi:hypothetical protein